MANITRREEQNRNLARSEAWDPFRALDQMFNMMRPLAPFMEGRTTALPQGVLSPAFEVKERDNAFVIEADLPGVEEDDVDVTVTGNRLTISGKREAKEEKEEDRYYTYERQYGSFTRSFTLPEGIDQDHIDAELESGVLSIIVPKNEEAQSKKISLKDKMKKKLKS